MYRIISKKTSANRVWYVVKNTTDANGKTKREYVESLGPVSKTEASMVLARYNAGVVVHKTGKISLKQVCDEFMHSYRQTAKARTFESFHRNMIRILPVLGYMPVADISFADIERLKRELLAIGTWGNRSVNIALIELSKLLKYALRMKYIPKMPEIDRLPERRQQIVERLTKEQVRELLDRSGEKERFYIEVMLQTGMRPQEFARLEWRDIDMTLRTVTIRSEQANKLGRTLPMTDRLHQVLSEAPVDYRIGRVLPWQTHWGPMQAMRKLGIAAYTLRKTFASAMVEAGVQVFELAKIMGHTDISTTYRYYTNLQHDTLRGAMSKNPFG